MLGSENSDVKGTKMTQLSLRQQLNSVQKRFVCNRKSFIFLIAIVKSMLSFYPSILPVIGVSDNTIFEKGKYNNIFEKSLVFFKILSDDLCILIEHGIT